MKHRIRLLVAAAAGFVLAAVALPAAAAPYVPPCTSNSDSCRQQRIVALEQEATRVRARLDALEAAASPSPSPSQSTASPTISATPTVTATPTATTTPAAFPDSASTGVPTGITLTAYTGPCAITAANTVITEKTVNCDLDIRAAGVMITKSKINGSVEIGENDPATYSFALEDSDVDAGDRLVTAVGSRNFTVRRSEVIGGNRSAHCWITCLIEDSYFHGQMVDESGQAHESGIRMGKGATIRHNTIVCDAPDVPPDAGCSADLTGYGDFATVENNLIENNFFKSTPGGYCVYGGSSAGKPYPNAHDIRFVDNVFGKTRTNDHGQPDCGYYGAATAFNSNAPGNVWTGNEYTDGAPVTP